MTLANIFAAVTISFFLLVVVLAVAMRAFISELKQAFAESRAAQDSRMNEIRAASDARISEMRERYDPSRQRPSIQPQTLESEQRSEAIRARQDELFNRAEKREERWDQLLSRMEDLVQRVERKAGV